MFDVWSVVVSRLCIYSVRIKLCLFFFFCKQKTAYEMRISDWSSDVCSSDLPERRVSRLNRPGCRRQRRASAAIAENELAALPADHDRRGVGIARQEDRKSVV